jgi:hypothetical protein
MRRVSFSLPRLIIRKGIAFSFNSAISLKRDEFVFYRNVSDNVWIVAPENDSFVMLI